MSKESAQIKRMMRSPKAMMDYQVSGKMPDVVAPSSPLITYLESVSPRDRVRMTSVNLSPKLGYNSGMQFHNAQMMLNYLKPAPWMSGSWPAKSLQIGSFRTTITDELFKSEQKNLDAGMSPSF